MAKKENVKTSELTKEEAIEQVVSLANAGHSPSKIGLILRDEYNVKNFRELTNKSLQEVLNENSLLTDIPEDLLNLIKRSVVLFTHMETNKKDFSAKHGYELTVSKIRRLSRYYIKKNKLPSDWRYTPETAALLVK
ncbi:MAG: 30S ribosomal protein S15 [Candidatus ainarchaeum sp.]|nr:30S ribosomal protein S15 [Candidatus ainarchaeum sp.]